MTRTPTTARKTAPKAAGKPARKRAEPLQRRPVVDCCAKPSLETDRTLVSTSRRDLELRRCRACSAWWLVEHEELAMNGNFDELLFDRYAQVTDAEAARLGLGHDDFAFLDGRPVLKSVQEGVLQWRTGWNGIG
jgi:hypothetical protein